MKMKNTKGAMEMSVGTIVTIVLLMSVLVLGIFFVQKVFKSANGALDLTDQQLQEQLQVLYANTQDNLAILPQSRLLKISAGEVDAIGLGIKNTERGGNSVSFSYKVEASGTDNEKNCGVKNGVLTNFIKQGSSGEKIVLAPGADYATKIRFELPKGAPLCIVRYKVLLSINGIESNADSFDIDIR